MVFTRKSSLNRIIYALVAIFSFGGLSAADNAGKSRLRAIMTGAKAHSEGKESGGLGIAVLVGCGIYSLCRSSDNKKQNTNTSTEVTDEERV